MARAQAQHWNKRTLCGWQKSVSLHTGMPMCRERRTFAIHGEPSMSYSCCLSHAVKGGYSPLLPSSQIPAANERQEDSFAWQEKRVPLSLDCMHG